MKQIQDAYIVAAVRTPGRQGPARHVPQRAARRHARARAQGRVAQVPGLDPHDIGDVIVGCAMPEAEQGMNVARIGVLLAGLPDTVPAMTINRFLLLGRAGVALAADRIRTGDDDVVIAAGTESMSMVPMMGNKIALNDAVFAKDENVAIAYGMGITAENVREAVEGLARGPGRIRLASHRSRPRRSPRAVSSPEILPYEVESGAPNSPPDRWSHEGGRHRRGSAADSSAESLAEAE
jgi:acetyl-CoA acyltransferase